MSLQINKSTIARAKAGDESATVAIYEAYRAKVQRYFHYRVGHRQAAEDLTTEVFLRVIENLPNYRQQNVPFQAWLFQIARNLAVDYFRRQSVRDHVPLDERITSNGEAPDSFVARSLVGEELQQALQRLTDGQSDVIVMRFIADMSIAEVAGALNKSESAVKSLQARGLEALHRILTQRKVVHERSR